MKTLTEIEEEIPFRPGFEPPKTNGALPLRDGNGYDFAPVAGKDNKVGSELVTPIHAGGTDEENRWGRFSQVWGHYLHCVRKGELTYADAERNCRGWVATQMVPPWSETVLAYQLGKLVETDVQKYGPLPKAQAAVRANPQDSHRFALTERPKFGVADDCDVLTFARGVPQENRMLVQGTIMCGEPHVLAAEDGGGKTQQLVDLAFKLAIYEEGFLLPDGQPLEWLGDPLLPPAAEGTIVIVTAEDSRNNIHKRVKRIDKFGLLERTRGRMKVLTLREKGGAFPFLLKRGLFAEPELTDRAKQLFDELAGFDKLLLAGFDPMATMLHTEDTNSKGVTEFLNLLGHRICGELGSALMVSHHFRKPGSKPVNSMKDMKQAIRGSTAITASARAVLGFLEITDKSGRKRFLGGICKENDEEFDTRERTFVRDDSGGLREIGRAGTPETPSSSSEIVQKAWIVAVVRRAALDGFPVWMSGERGLYKRRASLPPAINSRRHLTRATYTRLVEELIVAGRLVDVERIKPKGRVLDVPEGFLAGKKNPDDDRTPGVGQWVVDWSDYEYQAATGEVYWPDDSPETEWYKKPQNKW